MHTCTGFESTLGMSRTSVYIGERRDNVAMPYVYDRNGEKRTKPARGFFYNRFSPASGGVVSSLADMLTYVHAQLETERVADETLRDAIRLTLRPHAGDPVEEKNGNGIAWGRNQGRGTSAIYFDHDGLTIGHTTFVLFSPARNRGVVLLANTGFYGEHFSEFRRIGYEILGM